MGLFGKKKESVHFERDAEGRVVQVTRNGQPVDTEELKMKTGRQLEKEYYTKHPEKRHPTLKKVGRGLAAVDKRIVEYNRRSNIMNPQRSRPVQGFTFTPPGGISRPHKKKKSGKTKYAVVGDKAYPIAGTGKSKTKKKTTNRKTGFGYDPFDNWGWMK